MDLVEITDQKNGRFRWQSGRPKAGNIAFEAVSAAFRSLIVGTRSADLLSGTHQVLAGLRVPSSTAIVECTKNYRAGFRFTQ